MTSGSSVVPSSEEHTSTGKVFSKRAALFLLAGLFVIGGGVMVMLTFDDVSLFTGAVVKEVVKTASPLDASQEVNIALPASILVEQGDRAFRDGDFDTAKALFEQALQEQNDVSTMLRLYNVALMQHDIASAQSLLGLLSFRDVSDDQLDYLRGLLALRQGEREKALSLFESRPHRPDFAYGRALVAILDGDHEVAKEHLLLVHESSDPLLVHAARVLEAAYDEFALFRDGQPIHRMTLLARALAQVNRCPESVTILTDVVAQDASYRDAWNVLGYCQLLLNEPNNALESFQRAYAQDPERTETQYLLALAYERLGDAEQARTFFSYALENGLPALVKSESDVREKIAFLSLELDDPAFAVKQYEVMIDETDDPVASIRLTASLIDILIEEMNQPAQALIRAQEARDEHGDIPQVLDLLGWSLFASGDLEQADLFLTSALKADPDLSSAWYHQCAMVQTSDPVAALQSCKQSYVFAIEQGDRKLASKSAELYNVILESLPK